MAMTRNENSNARHKLIVAGRHAHSQHLTLNLWPALYESYSMTKGNKDRFVCRLLLAVWLVLAM